MWILAQDLSGLGGASGWVGTGLLGLVLGWLLIVHLPAKDKERKEEREAKDTTVASLMTAKDEALRVVIGMNQESLGQQRKDFRETLDALGIRYEASLKIVIAHCDGEKTK